MESKKKKRKTPIRKCSCTWKDCGLYTKQLNEVAPENHPWRSSVIRIITSAVSTQNQTENKVTFNRSIQHYLFDNGRIEMPSTVFIAPHHFPVSLFNWRQSNPNSRFTDYLSRKEAELISSESYSMNIISASHNSVFHVHNTFHTRADNSRRPVTSTYKCWYVQSPMSTRYDITSFIKSTCRTESKYIHASHRHDLVFDSYVDSSDEMINDPNEDIDHSEYQDPDISLQILCIQPEPFRYEDDHISKHTLSPDIELFFPINRHVAYEFNVAHKIPFQTSTYSAQPVIDKDIMDSTDESLRSPTPPLIPCVKDLHRLLIKKYEKYGETIDLFSNRTSVKEIAKILTVFHQHKSPFALAENKVFYYPCATSHNPSCTDCLMFSIHSYAFDREVFCSMCKNNIKKKKRKINRTVESPSRKRPYNCLTDNEKKEAFVNRGHSVKKWQQRYSRLIAKLEDETHMLQFGEGTPAMDVMKQAVDYIKHNSAHTESQILSMMMNLKISGTDGAAINSEERIKCAEYLTETVNNMTLHFNEKSKRCRYSPHIINLSLSLYLQNKTSYDHIRRSGIVNLPHPNTLKSITKEMKYLPGYDPNVYFSMKTQMAGIKGPLVGHLMVDEIKLKNGLAWNCMNNEVTGFICDQINTNHMFENILGVSLKKTDKKKQLAVYANQWRFRSTTGIIHNSNFYFNTGSLDANEITKQFIDVLLSYEFLNIKILGIVSDGGGGNENFFRTMTNNIPMTGPWPGLDTISFVNPIDTTRKVYIWSCGTHSLKAIRNNLYRSQPKFARNLKNNKIFFGWKDVERIYVRDESRKNNKGKCRTDLTKNCVNLDQYTMMNATYAKAVFTDKTLTEVFCYLAIHLGVKLEWKETYHSTWHKYSSNCMILKKAIKDGTPQIHIATYTLLEYQVAVYGIFVERLLNRFWSITKDNIEVESKVLSNIMQYFSRWMIETDIEDEEQNVGKRTLDSYHISHKTYRNLLTLVRGFVGYARAVLDISKDDTFIPALHCNQSSIEGLFSCIRSMSKDRTDLYASGILHQNISKLYKSMETTKGNTSYPTEYIAPELNTYSLRDQCKNIDRIGKQDSFSKEGVAALISHEKINASSDSVTYLFPSEILSSERISGFELFKYYKQHSLVGGKTFQQMLCNNPAFLAYAALSRGTKNEWFFTTIIRDKGGTKSKSLCQHINFELYTLLTQTTTNTDALVSYEYHIFKEIQKKESNVFDSLFQLHFNDLYEDSTNNKCCRTILVNILKHCFTEQWTGQVISAYKTDNLTFIKPISVPEDRMPALPVMNDDNVNRMFGWAIWKVKRKYKKLIDQGSVNMIYESKHAMLENMSVRVIDIVNNINYIRLYYPQDDALRNKGLLTLVAPLYIKHMSQILKLAYSSIACCTECCSSGIPDKNDVINMVKCAFDTEGNDPINDICNTSLEVLPITKLSVDDRKSLIWNLFDRVLNAEIGRCVKQYRQNKLSRVNDVSFRKRLAVKCEATTI